MFCIFKLFNRNSVGYLSFALIPPTLAAAKITILGLFFLKNQIPIDVVLSSEWCRCKDTAKYAFENYKTFSALNSFYSNKYQKNKNTQMRDLREYLKSWRSDKNLILVTHYVTILEIINKSSSSGEILITDSKLNLLGTITDY